MDLNTRAPLNDGHTIPQLGLGVYQTQPGPAVVNASLWALEAGYRHIDTAHIYLNEAGVGEAIHKSGLSREQLYVTTKLWNSDHGYDQTLRACDASLKELGLDFIDLYLVHWPVEHKRLDSWRAMERLKKDGKVKSIGISNYMKRHVQELLDHCEIPPVLNQIEMNPFIYQYRKDTIDFCEAHKICIESYSPLTKGRRLDDSRLQTLAAQHHKTPAQILRTHTNIPPALAL